jgi:hypothetical protein
MSFLTTRDNLLPVDGCPRSIPELSDESRVTFEFKASNHTVTLEEMEMSNQRLAGKRILVTQANEYMGPPITELFREEGAEVIADVSDLTEPGAAQRLVDSRVI